MTKKQVGERKGSFGLAFWIIVHHWRKSEQEPGGGKWCPWRGVLTHLLPQACPGCFLLEPWPPAQGWQHPQWLGPPYWSLVEIMPYSWMSRRHFLIWGSFLSNYCSPCQVDTWNQPVHLGRGNLNLWNCLYQIALLECPWNIFLINNGCEKTKLRVVSAAPGQIEFGVAE